MFFFTGDRTAENDKKPKFHDESRKNPYFYFLMKCLRSLLLFTAACSVALMSWGQRTEVTGDKVFQQCQQQRLMTQIKELKFALGEPFIRDEFMQKESTSQRSYDAMQCAVLEQAVEVLILRVLEGEGGYSASDFAPVVAGNEPVVAFRTCGDALHHQGVNYRTVLAGGNCWMSEPLRAVQFTDGTPMNELRSPAAWQDAAAGWCVYDSLHHHAELAGLIYNGFAALTEEHGGVCPEEWHVASRADWEALQAAYGLKGTALKSREWDGTDASGMGLVPGGFRETTGEYVAWGTTAVYWTAEPAGILHSIASGDLPTTHSAHPLNTGASILCVQD